MSENSEKSHFNVIPKKIPMPQQSPEERVRNFKEVPLGYTEEQAIEEANRCLKCKKSPCMKGCPVEVDIPSFIELVSKRKFYEAAKKIKEKNALPAICGRVCPQEEQCEKYCTLSKKYESVAIGRLERFVADWERKNGLMKTLQTINKNNQKVAVIGSGPSSLTVAADLAVKGYKVTIFEALHAPGGVLIYGIPEFRLPKSIVEAEIKYIKSLGVDIVNNAIVGYLYSIDELFEKGFKAIFIGIGAGGPMFMNIPGENLNGVYSANEFLTRSNLMKAYLFPEYHTPVRRGKKIAVVGGGNVAMDAARTAIRLGADEVHIIYRRSRDEMPARAEEIEHAFEEGIIFNFLTNPVKIIGDEKGNVKSMECIKMMLGEADSTGRRRPIPVTNSEFLFTVDTIIMALGTTANPLLTNTIPTLKVNKWGYMLTDSNTGATNIEGLYAGGDIVTGAATVISAMGAGRKAARTIDEFMKRDSHLINTPLLTNSF
jgi:glutamate synthase (NADPH/NADH) small chain